MAEIKIINPEFKYKDTRKPNKVNISKKPWNKSHLNGITGFNIGLWSINGGSTSPIKVQSLKTSTPNGFKVFHG